MLLNIRKYDNTSMGIICLYYNLGCCSLRMDLNMSFFQPYQMIKPSSQCSVTMESMTLASLMRGWECKHCQCVPCVLYDPWFLRITKTLAGLRISSQGCSLWQTRHSKCLCSPFAWSLIPSAIHSDANFFCSCEQVLLSMCNTFSSAIKPGLFFDFVSVNYRLGECHMSSLLLTCVGNSVSTGSLRQPSLFTNV